MVIYDIFMLNEILKAKQKMENNLQYLYKLKEKLEKEIVELKERVIHLEKNIDHEIGLRIIEEKGNFYRKLKEFNREHSGQVVLKYDEKNKELLLYKFDFKKRNKLILKEKFKGGENDANL